MQRAPDAVRALTARALPAHTMHKGSSALLRLWWRASSFRVLELGQARYAARRTVRARPSCAPCGIASAVGSTPPGVCSTSRGSFVAPPILTKVEPKIERTLSLIQQRDALPLLKGS